MEYIEVVRKRITALVRERERYKDSLLTEKEYDRLTDKLIKELKVLKLLEDTKRNGEMEMEFERKKEEDRRRFEFYNAMW